MLFVELAFVIAGFAFLFRRGLRVGDYVLRRPYTAYIGLILMLQFPVALLGGFAVGAAESVKAMRSNIALDGKRLVAKYQYLDVAVCGVAFLLAGAVAARGVRRFVPEYMPEEEITGVRNLMAERDEADDEDDDAPKRWRVRDAEASHTSDSSPA